MVPTHAEARRIAERHGGRREGSLGWLFAETGAIPMRWELLMEDLAPLKRGEREAMRAYLAAHGPRASLDGWERLSAPG